MEKEKYSLYVGVHANRNFERTEIDSTGVKDKFPPDWFNSLINGKPVFINNIEEAHKEFGDAIESAKREPFLGSKKLVEISFALFKSRCGIDAGKLFGLSRKGGFILIDDNLPSLGADLEKRYLKTKTKNEYALKRFFNWFGIPHSESWTSRSMLRARESAGND